VIAEIDPRERKPMKLRSRRTLALTASLVAVAGGSAALANAQSSGGGAKPHREAALGKDAYLDSVAQHLGIERSKLDSALDALVTRQIDWAADAGFITKEQAQALKERASQRDGRLWLPLALEFRLGFGLGGFPLGPFGLAGSGFSAAADYLGLTPAQLRGALDDKTLAQVTADQGKSLEGLKQALHDAAKSALDDARGNGAITQRQEDALLARLDSTLDDTLNGRSPLVTALAKELGVGREELVAALRDAASDQVDKAVSEGYLTQNQAGAIKKRIQSAGDETFGLGPGLGFGLRFGFGFPFGPGFGARGFGDVFPGLPGKPLAPFGRFRDGFPFAPGGHAAPFHRGSAKT
jgi:uncharacterized protein YidB (DUF937 family)